MLRTRPIKAPDLRVLDAAIHRIQAGWNNYSCCALTSAAHTLHPRNYDISIYAQQYARWCHRKANWQWCRKFWNIWGIPSPENRHLRVRALQEFKSACIAAALKKQGKP